VNFNYEIVVLSYNHPQLTTLTLNSVLSFGFPAEQVHLVHNGTLLPHQQQLQSLFPQIKHHILPANKGFSGGANFGLSEVFKAADSILFLTNDTEVISLPNDFPTALDLFSIRILKRNTNQVDSIIGAIDLKKGHLSHVRDLTHLKNSLTTYIPGTAFGLSKNAFTRLKGFDETLHTYWEDVELSLRAHHLGLKVGSNELFQVKHKIGKTCHKDRFYTLFLFQRNRKRILKKYGQSFFNLQFYSSYFLDMSKIAWRILKGDEKKANLNLWWKAIYDKS